MCFHCTNTGWQLHLTASRWERKVRMQTENPMLLTIITCCKQEKILPSYCVGRRFVLRIKTLGEFWKAVCKKKETKPKHKLIFGLQSLFVTPSYSQVCQGLIFLSLLFPVPHLHGPLSFTHFQESFFFKEKQHKTFSIISAFSPQSEASEW